LLFLFDETAAAATAAMITKYIIQHYSAARRNVIINSDCGCGKSICRLQQVSENRKIPQNYFGKIKKKK